MIPSPDEHLSMALFQAMARGEVADDALDHAFFRELAAHCPHCAAGLEALREARAAHTSAGALAFPAPRAPVAVASAPDRSVLAAVASLEVLPPGERLRRVNLGSRKYRGLALATALLDHARACLPADGSASRDWAEVGLRVLELTHAPDAATDLEIAKLSARGWGLIANADRIAGNLYGAERRFTNVGAWVRARKICHLPTIAELRSFVASLRAAQRRFEEAEELLQTSIALYQVAGVRLAEVRTLFKLAFAQTENGEPAEALKTLRQADQCLVDGDSPQMFLILLHNQLLARLALGDFAEAQRLVAEVESLRQQAAVEHSEFQFLALQGRLAAGLKEPAKAEGFFRAAQAGFLADQDAFKAALVSLDLSLVLLEQGRTAEVRELASAMAAAFESLGVHREALAAWRLFVATAEHEAVSAALAQRLAKYLIHSSRDPEHRFSVAE